MLIRSKTSIKDFYERSISELLPTEERLLAPVSDDFIHICSKINLGKDLSQAIDLGYGYGNYSIALAQIGFLVTAIDFIKPSYFHTRAIKLGLEQRIKIIEADLHSYVPDEVSYDFVVSKDTLHFLSKERVAFLLNKLKKNTRHEGYHYLAIFTDISRISTDGKRVVVDGEADFSTDSLVALLKELYVDWKLQITIMEYKEKNHSDGTNFFSANRLTLIAHKVKV